MRTHKYKYWYSGKMLEVGSIEFMTDGTYRVNDELVGGILREFTGLLDKNQVEIYEGDIVNWKHIEDSGVSHIVFDSGSFIIANTTFTLYQMYMTSIEIIGNIYDNPELINNK